MNYNEKPTYTTNDMILKRHGAKKSFLKSLNGQKTQKLNVSASPEYDGRKGFNSNTDSYYYKRESYPMINKQFDIWVTAVNYGYGVIGQEATSQFYNKFYPQRFSRTPISVEGICRHEMEYNELSRFVRENQVNATIDHNNLMLLDIPFAGIRCIGLIPEIDAGVAVENNGIPLAPTFVFNFLVLRDLKDENDNKFSQGAVAKFSHFEKSNKIIDDVDDSVPLIFSSPALKLNGNVNSAGRRQTNPRPRTNRANSNISSGTNGARGS